MVNWREDRPHNPDSVHCFTNIHRYQNKHGPLGTYMGLDVHAILNVREIIEMSCCCCVLRDFLLVNANASVLWIFYIFKNQTCMNIFPGHIWVFHSNGNAEISFIYFSTLLMHTFPHFSTLLMHTWGLHRDENIDWGARVIEMESPPNIHISNIHIYIHTYFHTHTYTYSIHIHTYT